MKNSKTPQLDASPKAVITKANPRQPQSFNFFDDEFLDFFGDAKTYKQIKKIVEETSTEEECNHEKFSDVDGINICESCGCEIEKLDFQPEWRFYGAADNKTTKDPSRCHRTRETTKGGIDKVFQDSRLGYLNQATRKKAEMKYKQIVGDETVRGKRRKSIVAACLLYTFRDEGDIRTSDEVRKMFCGSNGSGAGLTKQEMSEGLRRYHSIFKEDRTQHITPSHLIKRIMYLTKINMSHHKSILKIAKCLEGVDETLNRSSPQSVASAIVYFYLCLNPTLKLELGLTKTKFAKDVKLSDITISKLVKKTAEIIGLQIDI